MNRRSFFSRLLGAACLAVAERVMPSSLAGTVKPMFAEPEPSENTSDWTVTLGEEPLYHISFTNIELVDEHGRRIEIVGGEPIPPMLWVDDAEPS